MNTTKLKFTTKLNNISGLHVNLIKIRGEPIMENGKRVSVWIPIELYQLAEKYRAKLGISQSGFYRTAIIRFLEELSRSELIKAS